MISASDVLSQIHINKTSYLTTMSLENVELVKTVISYAIPILVIVALIIWFCIDDLIWVYMDDFWDLYRKIVTNVFAVVFLLLTVCIVAYFPMCMAVKKKQVEYYNTCVSNDYTVYLNGEKVSYPDKLNIKGYKISFDNKKKEIILSD